MATIGEMRLASLVEMREVLADVMTLLESDGIVERHYEMDVVIQALDTIRPIAVRLACQPTARSRPVESGAPLITTSRVVHTPYRELPFAVAD